MTLKAGRFGADDSSMRCRRVFVVGLLVVSAIAGATSESPAAAAPGDPDPEHPFSEPVWLPLRNSAEVGCARTNCQGPYHNFHALDLVAERGDPIYAAGAGIFHIGDIDPPCTPEGPTAGTWVWVDHGPAGRSRYSHLDSIEAVEGQLVTPETVIGTVGTSGGQSPCLRSYLHFEYRTDASNTTRTPISSFKGCIAGDTVELPQVMGYASWDDIPVDTIPTADRIHTPDTDNSCLPSWSLTPVQPSATLARGVEQLTITPSARPGDVDAVRVRVEQWHPTIDRFGSMVDQTIPPSQSSATFTDLIPGKTYRARVSFHNDAGWSAWSEPVIGVPGVIPTPPGLRGIDSTLTTIGYKWHRGSNLDAEHDVAIRRVDGTTKGPWTYYPVEPTAFFYRFRELDRGTRYEVTVRARNEFGTSDWAPGEIIRTLGCETDCDVFTPLEPQRFADSRNQQTFDGSHRNTGPRPAGTTWEIAVAGRGGVPTGATAAIVNLTVLNGHAPGHATVYPCGELPTASSVNYVPGAVEPNEVIAKLSPTGTICVFTLSTADVIVDVVGHVTGSPYQPLAPTRYADSRTGDTFDGTYRNTGRRAAGTTWEIPIAGRGGVPASATTAAVNVTVTGGTGPGFATVFPCGDLPVASSLNYDVGITRPNELVAKLSPTGTICVYTLTDVDVIVDVVGYMGDVAGFTPLAPVRVADSRNESTVDGKYRNTGRLGAGETWEISIEGRAGVNNASAVIANVTVTGALAPGFLTIYECGDLPTASSLNYFVGTTRPNETIAKLSASGALCIYTLSPAHVIVDIVGFTND